MTRILIAYKGALPADNAAPASKTANKPVTALALPRLTIPPGYIPEHIPGDSDGKQAYLAWYTGVATKPGLGDALAMRRYFADRARMIENPPEAAMPEKKPAANKAKPNKGIGAVTMEKLGNKLKIGW